MNRSGGWYTSIATTDAASSWSARPVRPEIAPTQNAAASTTDRTTGGEILNLMEQLNSELGKTIVMVTHDPRAAARARRMVHLEKGVLVSDADWQAELRATLHAPH